MNNITNILHLTSILLSQTEAQHCVYQLVGERWSGQGQGQCPLYLPHHQQHQQLLYAVHAYHQVCTAELHNVMDFICFFQDTRQLFSIMTANLNSILNPIIYAFWYPDFRKTLRLQLHHLLFWH